MELRFAIYKNGQDSIRNHVCETLVSTLENYGHQLVGLDDHLNFVINHTSLQVKDHYYRKSRNEWVISVLRIPDNTSDLKSACYSTLIRTLSNMVIGLLPGKNENELEVYCITPEVGFYHFTYQPDKIYEKILPVVTAHILLKNELIYDLNKANVNSNKKVESLKIHGRLLDQIGLLPQPFPIQNLLSKKDLDHLYHFFQIKGISYGNISIRDNIPGLEENTFWMTARGVDKGNLSAVGKDILLVGGFDDEKQAMRVHTTKNGDPKARVSVDAIEHHLIYKSFPEVKAIIHVHAWMDNIESTFQNYPCGTLELANSVVEIIQKSNTPEKVVVGLKNHGLTITGTSLEDIFKRIEGKLIPTVPMYE